MLGVVLTPLLLKILISSSPRPKEGTISITIKITITIIMGSWWHGGSGKLKSSKDDNTLNTLRDGRKGDPLHKYCGKKC